MRKRHKPLDRRLRDFATYRSRPLRGWLKHRLWRRLVPYRAGGGPLRLHVGSGMQRLDGWVNLDLQQLPEVDIARDVTSGLPFSGVELVYAEHFLEHLEVTGALDFLAEAHRVLAADGRLRLSTPNLDWVWRHVYRPPEAAGVGAPRMAMHANRAFYGWRHRFLWNRPLLERALTATGFAELRWCCHGESDLEAFSGIERHETYEDTPELPHVLIVEGRKGTPDGSAAEALRSELQAHFLDYMND